MTQNRRPRGLADFADPPLTEVALSIQYEPLTAFQYVDLSPLWHELQRRYPKVEQQPPLPPAFEIFGVPAPTGARMIQLSPIPTMPRFWFANEAGTELLQFQWDRFVHNWRKTGEGVEYPRYERIRQTFFREFERLFRFVERRHGRGLAPNQCEITYVNQIPFVEDGPNPITDSLSMLQVPDNFPAGSPEDVGMQVRFVLANADGQSIGRLIVQAGTAITPAGIPMFQLMLTVRGRPSTADIRGVREFMDRGRKIIVDNFTAITTDRMHKLWGRRK
jgi:uncharacterized protein (TIGR04255 family)